MSAVHTEPAATPAEPAGGLAPRLFTVDEVVRMAEAGILAEGERVELIDGRLHRMSPEGRRHLALVAAVTRLLVAHYPPPYAVCPQSTLRLDEVNFREPDFAVTDAPLWERAPRPDEIALLVEVAETSLRYDLGAKALAYAAWGAPDYWVIDVGGRRLLAHSEPEPGGYRRITPLGPDETATLPRVGARVTVRDLLPPA